MLYYCIRNEFWNENFCWNTGCSCLYYGTEYKTVKGGFIWFEPVSKDTMGSLKIFETRWHYTKNKINVYHTQLKLLFV